MLARLLLAVADGHDSSGVAAMLEPLQDNKEAQKSRCGSNAEHDEDSLKYATRPGSMQDNPVCCC